MDHAKALLLKFIIMAFVVLPIFTLLYQMPTQFLALTLILTVGAYLIGDLVILPKFGDIAAFVSDFALSFSAILVFGFFFVEFTFIYTTAAFFTAFLLAVGEGFYHYYVHNAVLDESFDRYKDLAYNHILQSEIANEMDIHDLKSEEDDRNNNG